MANGVDYDIATSDQIASDIGRRLEAVRLLRNMTQEELSKRSGLGLRTITRIEAGEPAKLDTLIRIMIALDLTSHLATLLPDTTVRPMDRVRLKGRERRRASPKTSIKEEEPFRWGDEEDSE